MITTSDRSRPTSDLVTDQKLAYPGFAKLKEAAGNPLSSVETKIKFAQAAQKRRQVTEQIRRTFRLVD